MDCLCLFLFFIILFLLFVCLFVFLVVFVDYESFAINKLLLTLLLLKDQYVLSFYLFPPLRTKLI